MQNFDDANSVDEMHVLCAADANYAAYAGITMNSVARTNASENLHFHLLSDGIRASDLKKFLQLKRTGTINVSFYDIKEMLDGVPALRQGVNHISRAMFGRLLVSQCIPRSVQRLIYLDCDIICQGSLRPLWNVGATVPFIAASRDEWIDQQSSHKASLNMPETSPYYNSGVLLINLPAWGERNAESRIIDYLNCNPKLKNPDQDAINALFWRDIVELDQKWNVIVSRPPHACQVPDEAINLHFCGGFKPWFLGYKQLVRAQYRSFHVAKHSSPWRWKIPDLHLRRFVRKASQITKVNLT